jgi:hypothetical protein
VSVIGKAVNICLLVYSSSKGSTGRLCSDTDTDTENKHIEVKEEKNI